MSALLCWRRELQDFSRLNHIIFWTAAQLFEGVVHSGVKTASNWPSAKQFTRSTTSSSANFRLPSFLSNWRASSHHCNHSPHFSNLAWATVMLLELFHLLSSSCMSRYVIASWARSERHSTLDALILDSVRSWTSLKMDMVGPSPHSSAVRRILCNDAGGRRSRMMENLFRSKPFVLNNASDETFSFRTRLKSCQAQLCRPMTWCCWKEMSPQCPHQGHLNTFYSWQSASIDSIRLGL